VEVGLAQGSGVAAVLRRSYICVAVVLLSTHVDWPFATLNGSHNSTAVPYDANALLHRRSRSAWRSANGGSALGAELRCFW
jgi:hypothetical protein